MTRNLIFLCFFLIFWIPNCFAVVNGISLNYTDKPEVVRLNIIRLDGSTTVEDSCTGVAISDDLVLTAGHCVNTNTKGATNSLFYNQFLKDGTMAQVQSLNAYSDYIEESFVDNRPDQLIPGCSTHIKPVIQTQTTDLGLVRFPKNTFSIWANMDFQTPLQLGDSLDYYGYGVHNNSFIYSTPYKQADAHDLRFGNNLVWRMNDQRIAFLANPSLNFADHGDSGAPVYKGNQVVAIISTIEEHCETEYGSDYAIRNTAISLASNEALVFFDKALKQLSK